MALLVAAMLLVGQVLEDGSGDAIAEVPTEPEATIEVEEETPPPAVLSPYRYLYATYPSIARRMDCVISRESGWVPSAVNRRSGASGLAQFLLSTWRSTPQGRAGLSRFDPYANIDGAAWLARNVGWRQWQVVTLGYC